MASQEIDLNIDLNIDVMTPEQRMRQIEKTFRATDEAARRVTNAIQNWHISGSQMNELRSYLTEIERAKASLTEGIRGTTIPAPELQRYVQQLREVTTELKTIKTLADRLDQTALGGLNALISTRGGTQPANPAENRDIRQLTNTLANSQETAGRIVAELDRVVYQLVRGQDENIKISTGLENLIDKLNRSSILPTGIRTAVATDGTPIVTRAGSNVNPAYDSARLTDRIDTAFSRAMKDITGEIVEQIKSAITNLDNNTQEFIKATLKHLKDAHMFDSVPALARALNAYTPGLRGSNIQSISESSINDLITEIKSARQTSRSVLDFLGSITRNSAAFTPVPRTTPRTEDALNRVSDMLDSVRALIAANAGTSGTPAEDNHIADLLSRFSADISNQTTFDVHSLLQSARTDLVTLVQAINSRFNMPSNSTWLPVGSHNASIIHDRIFSALAERNMLEHQTLTISARNLQNHFDIATAEELLNRFRLTIAAMPDMFTFNMRMGNAIQQIITLLNPSNSNISSLTDSNMVQQLLNIEARGLLISAGNRNNTLRDFSHADLRDYRTEAHAERNRMWASIGQSNTTAQQAQAAAQVAQQTAQQTQQTAQAAAQVPPPPPPTPAPTIDTTTTEGKATRLLDLLIDTVHFTKAEIKEVKSLTQALTGDAFAASTLGQMFSNGSGFRKFTDASNTALYDIVYKNRQSILSETKIAEILHLNNDQFIQKVFEKEQTKYSPLNLANREYYGHLIKTGQYTQATGEDRTILTIEQFKQAFKNYAPMASITASDAALTTIMQSSLTGLKKFYDMLQIAVRQVSDHMLPDSMFSAALPRIDLTNANVDMLGGNSNGLSVSFSGMRSTAGTETDTQGNRLYPRGDNSYRRRWRLGEGAYHAYQVNHAPSTYFKMPAVQSEFILRQLELYKDWGMTEATVSPEWTGRALWPSGGFHPDFVNEYAQKTPAEQKAVIKSVIRKLQSYFTGRTDGLSFNLEGSSSSEYGLFKDGNRVATADLVTINEYLAKLEKLMQKTTPGQWFNIGKSGIGARAGIDNYVIKKLGENRKLNPGWAIISALSQTTGLNAHRFDLQDNSDSMKTLSYSYMQYVVDAAKNMFPGDIIDYVRRGQKVMFSGDTDAGSIEFKRLFPKALRALQAYQNKIVRELNPAPRVRRPRPAAIQAPVTPSPNTSEQQLLDFDTTPEPTPSNIHNLADLMATLSPVDANFLRWLSSNQERGFSLLDGGIATPATGLAKATIRRNMSRILLGDNSAFSLGTSTAYQSPDLAMAQMLRVQNRGLLGAPVAMTNPFYGYTPAMPTSTLLQIGGPVSRELDNTFMAMRPAVTAGFQKLLSKVFTTEDVYTAPIDNRTLAAFIRARADYKRAGAPLQYLEDKSMGLGGIDLYRPRKDWYSADMLHEDADPENIRFDFSYLRNRKYDLSNPDTNVKRLQDLMQVYQTFAGKVSNMQYGIMDVTGRGLHRAFGQGQPFFNYYAATGQYDPNSVTNGQFYNTDTTWKGIIGLTDAEEALGMSSERAQFQLDRQKKITLEKADATKKLSHEIERLSQLEHQLKQNTEATIGFNKTQINNAVSAFTDAGSIRMKRADIGTGTTGAYRDTVLEMYNKAEQQKNVNGVPFWVKDYYKGADGKIYFTKEYAEFESVRNKKLGTTVNKYRNEAGEADYRFRRGLDPNTFNEDLLPRAQAIRRGRFSSMSDLAEMLGYSTSGNPLAYNSKGGVTAFNVLANPAKLAKDLERYLGANSTAFERLQQDKNLTFENAYANYLTKFRSMVYDKAGNMKSNEELKKLLTDKQFTEIFLGRLDSNIKAFDERLKQAGVDALELGLAKNKAESLQERGRFGTGYETHRMFLGDVGTIIKNLDANGNPIMYGGTEEDYLYRRFGRGERVPPKTKEQLVREGSQSWITRTFGIPEAKTYEGAVQNASQYARQLYEDAPRFLQAINLSYTKAAFAFSRVAYGIRVISMELTAMGRQFYTTFTQGLTAIYKYTDGITKATETQQKAKVTLTGVFDAKRADEMVSFARKYAVTSPATFGEITQMMKSFGLTPQIRDMVQGSKDMTATLKELSYVTVGLGSTKPQQGIEGAMFAIREAMSGQFTSLKRRFEISPDVIAAMMGTSMSKMKNSPETFIAGLKKFLDLNVGEDTLQKLSMTYQVQLNNITDFIEQAQALIGSAGFYDTAVGIANKIADAFANILNVNEFREKLTQISDFMIATAGAITTGLNDIFAQVVPIANEDSTRKSITDQILATDKNMPASELKTRADFGMTIMRVTQLLTVGLRILSGVTREVVGYFQELFKNFKLSEETIFEFTALVGKITHAFADLFATFVKGYVGIATWITNAGFSKNFQAMALIFTMFPVASANIAINAVRGMFESLLALNSPQLHSALSGMVTHMTQLTGALLNLGKTSLSWTALKEGMAAIYNPMMGKNVNPIDLQNILVEKKTLSEALAENLITRDTYEFMNTQLIKRADALADSIVVSTWTARLGKGLSMAAFGARFLLAGALGAIFAFGITEAIASGNIGDALLKTGKRVLGLFATINKGIDNWFGTGWFGTIIKAGGIVVLIAPAASFNVAVAGFQLLSSAAITAFTAIASHPDVIAVATLIGMATKFTQSETFRTLGSKVNADVYTSRVQGIADANTQGGIKNWAYLKGIDAGLYSYSSKEKDPDFYNKFGVFDRKRMLAGKESLFTKDGNIMFSKITQDVATEFKSFNESSDKLLNSMTDTFTKGKPVSLADALGQVLPGMKELEEAGENLGKQWGYFDEKNKVAADNLATTTKALQNASAAGKELVETYKAMLGLKMEETTDPTSKILKPYLQRAQALDMQSAHAKEISEKYAKQDKDKEADEIKRLITEETARDKQKEANLYEMMVVQKLITGTKEVKASISSLYDPTTTFASKIDACRTGFIETQGAADAVYSSVNKLSGLVFNIPVILALQISDTLGAMPDIGNAIPGGGAMNALRGVGDYMKSYIGNVVKGVNDADLHKRAHEIVSGNSTVPGLNDALKQAGAGGADKASELKEKYSKMLKDLDREILESQGHNIKARIEAAKHEADAKLEEVSREFKGTKYLAELTTKVKAAEAAKQTKLINDLRKDVYNDLLNSKYASPDSQMKAFDYIKGEELKAKLTDLNDLVDAKLISAAEAKELATLSKYAVEMERIEKRYEVLKSQPKLTDLIGGKDADKLIENLTGNFAKYVTTLDNYNKRVSATTTLTSSYERILSETEKARYSVGNTTYNTTTKTTVDANKLRSPKGLTSGVSSNALLAEFANLYEQEQLTIIKQEVEQLREMSELQIKRLQVNGQVFGMSVDTVRAMREQLITAKTLMEVEELHYKQLERKVKMSNDIRLQMKYAIDESIRQLPSNYEIVKSATQNMFGTLKEGLSNVLVAGFSRDTEKMRDLWGSLMTDLKTAFLKMVSDLIVKNWMEQLFGNLFPSEEKKKQAKQDSALQAIAGGSTAGLGSVLAGFSGVPGMSAVGAMLDATTSLSATQVAGASSIQAASTTASTAIYNLANACAEAANFIRANTGGGDGISLLDTMFGGSISGAEESMGGAAGMLVGANAGVKFLADGGIVSAPTLAALRDGGQNEAVVPLPNGRAIPVQMTGDGGTGSGGAVTIVNVMDKELINQMIAENPNTVVNVISADIIKGGSVSKAINIRKK